MITVPGEMAFGAAEYMKAPELEALVRGPLMRWPEFEPLREFDIRVLWKAEGTGEEVAGRCRKLSGELKFYVGADWLIWVAADIVRLSEWDDEQIEALLYHELSHCAVKEDKNGEKVPAMKKHEVTMFRGEIERYGLWDDNLVRTKKAFDKVPLPGFERPSRPREGAPGGSGITSVSIGRPGGESVTFTRKDLAGLAGLSERLRGEFGAENVEEGVPLEEMRQVDVETGEVIS